MERYSLGRKHSRSVQIAWEQVLDAEPEVIVLALCGYKVARARAEFELLRCFPHFDSLPAARNGAIYLVDASAYFARPGPRIRRIASSCWLGSCILTFSGIRACDIRRRSHRACFAARC